MAVNIKKEEKCILRFTFRGGIHPDDGKALSKDKPIREVLPKGELVYPLSQHIGAPAKAIVAKGDHVLAGQKIAEAGGFVSANIFASVSGTVKAIEARLGVAGGMQESIVIENDGLYEEVEFSPERKLADISGKEIIEIIKEAGIVGMGGAGFPTHVKYMPKDPSAIDHIIVNCAECEPYLTSDYRRMMEEPEKIVGGLQAAMKIFDGRAKGVLAVEDNKKDAAAKLREAAKGIPDIEVVELKTKYPQGAERQLIFAVTGRQINSSMLPADAGCVVNNCDTIHAIYEAVHFGRPVMKKVMTITGNAIKEPQNLRVRTGTNFRELIEEAGGFTSEPEKIIAGGPMMGIPLISLDVPVVKTSSAILCMTKDEVAACEETACINCGRCVSVCPGRIIPAKLADYAKRHDKESFEKANGMECCECGCCSYICPAKRPLTQYIKSMRKMVLADRKKVAQRGNGK